MSKWESHLYLRYCLHVRSRCARLLLLKLFFQNMTEAVGGRSQPKSIM